MLNYPKLYLKREHKLGIDMKILIYILNHEKGDTKAVGMQTFMNE